MAIENGTYLSNLFDPQVVGDMIDAKLIDNMVFAPLCVIDNTLEGRPGSKITLPQYAYIGDATVVAEGEDIPISELNETTVEKAIHKIGKGVQITDEALLSGYGDPKGEAIKQLTLAIASKSDGEVLAELGDITATMTYTAATPEFAADDVSDALVKFGEDVDGVKVILVSPAFYNVLRKASDWVPASEMAAEMVIKGAVGEIYGCQVIISNKLTTSKNAYIVKPGALRFFVKRNTLVETDRDIVNKSTVLTADKHGLAYLYDASKAIKMVVTPAENFSLGAVDGTDTILGATVSTLQSNIAFANGLVTGTLKYKTGFTGFSGDPELQEGNYLAVEVDADNFSAVAGTGTNIYMKLLGGAGSEVMFDGDKNGVVRVTNAATQKLQFRIVTTTAEDVVVYELKDLVIEPKTE